MADHFKVVEEERTAHNVTKEQTLATGLRNIKYQEIKKQRMQEQ